MDARMQDADSPLVRRRWTWFDLQATAQRIEAAAERAAQIHVLLGAEPHAGPSLLDPPEDANAADVQRVDGYGTEAARALVPPARREARP